MYKNILEQQNPSELHNILHKEKNDEANHLLVFNIKFKKWKETSVEGGGWGGGDARGGGGGREDERGVEEERGSGVRNFWQRNGAKIEYSET